MLDLEATHTAALAQRLNRRGLPPPPPPPPVSSSSCPSPPGALRFNPPMAVLGGGRMSTLPSFSDDASGVGIDEAGEGFDGGAEDLRLPEVSRSGRQSAPSSREFPRPPSMG